MHELGMSFFNGNEYPPTLQHMRFPAPWSVKMERVYASAGGWVSARQQRCLVGTGISRSLARRYVGVNGPRTNESQLGRPLALSP